MAQLSQRFRFTLVLAGAGFLAACAAEAPRAPQMAVVYSTSAGQALTAPSSEAPLVVVQKFLGQVGLAKHAASLRTLREGRNARTGIHHLRIEQAIDGLRVHGAYAKAALNDRGELVHLIEKVARIGDKSLPAINADEADVLAVVMQRLGYLLEKTPARLQRKGNTTYFAPGTLFHAEPSVERVLYLDAQGKARGGYLAETWTRSKNLLHHTLVDAELRVVDVELRTAKDSYNVFTKDPTNTPTQTVVTGPGTWLSGAQKTTNIKGNNVNAYLDVDANNRVDSGGTTVTTGDFLASANLAAQPSAPGNRAAAVQNLFYLNNMLHDILYGHGFNEVAGNFQVDNFSLGGAGNDAVLAEAQDGSGTDNANFATPRDGRNPRMQMYLWSGLGPTHEVVSGGTSYPGAGAEFGPALTTAGVTFDLAVMSPADGCTAATASLTGKIAIIDRGTCNFDVKVKNAQLAGAKAAIIANTTTAASNPGEAYFTMGASAPAVKGIKISAVMVGFSSGVALKGAVGTSATARKHSNPPLMIDASFDSDIVYHEYGHGLTWRMIGSMSGAMSGAIGEGASDALAMLINGDDVVAEYSASSAGGIRSAPYAGYSRTYANFTGDPNQVHYNGEIYAAIIWKLIDLFGASGRDTLFGYFVDGMNYTPAAPAFEHMRDGILQAAAGSTADQCLIWTAFAQFGVGDGASGATTPPTATSSIPGGVCP